MAERSTAEALEYLLRRAAASRNTGCRESTVRRASAMSRVNAESRAGTGPKPRKPCWRHQLRAEPPDTAALTKCLRLERTVL